MELEVKQGSNAILGMIGAIIGAILGSILWVLIYQFGYIASLAGYAIIFCAYKGYVLLGKGNDKKAVILSTLISIIVLIAAHYFCWSIDIYNELSVEYEVTIMEAVAFTPEVILYPENLVLFFKDLIVGFVLVAIGTFSFLKSALKEAEGADSEDVYLSSNIEQESNHLD